MSSAKVRSVRVVPLGSPSFLERPNCHRQAFVDEESAIATARALSKLGIIRKPVRCRTCHAIHLSDPNGKPDQS